jgi:hypothetical protein
MKTSFLLALAVAFATAGNVSGAQIAYTDGGATNANLGNTTEINIGREFTVSGKGIYVTSLGIYDENGGNEISLTNAHSVTLFSISNTGTPTSETALATATVGPGETGAYLDGFQFANIPTTYLAPGNYAVIAYGLDDGNIAYGDGGGRVNVPGVVVDANFDPYQFNGSSSPAFPTGGDSNNHNGASFEFIAAVPEPSSLAALAGLGAMGLFVLLRRRKA